MTSTLSGYLVYRLQDKLREKAGVKLNYQVLIDALTESLLELDNDMDEGNEIELPTGRYFTISKRLKWEY